MITKSEARLIVCGMIRNAWFGDNMTTIAPNVKTVTVMLFRWQDGAGVDVWGQGVPDWMGMSPFSDEVYDAFIGVDLYGTSALLEVNLDTIAV